MMVGVDKCIKSAKGKELYKICILNFFSCFKKQRED